MAGSGVITRQYCSCTAASSMICAAVSSEPVSALQAAAALALPVRCARGAVQRWVAHGTCLGQAPHGSDPSAWTSAPHRRCTARASRGKSTAGPRPTLPSRAMSDAGVSECAGGGCGMGATYTGGTSVCASASFVPASCRLLTARPASACEQGAGKGCVPYHWTRAR